MNELPDHLLAFEHEAAAFLQRAEQRAKQAGAFGCGSALGLAFLLAIAGAFDTGAGWFMLFVGFFVLMSLFARGATKNSIADFRRTFQKSGADPARRDVALRYLWARAFPDSKRVAVSTAAKSLLKELGVVQPPRVLARALDAIAPTRAEVEVEPAAPEMPRPSARGDDRPIVLPLPEPRTPPPTPRASPSASKPASSASVPATPASSASTSSSSARTSSRSTSTPWPSPQRASTPPAPASAPSRPAPIVAPNAPAQSAASSAPRDAAAPPARPPAAPSVPAGASSDPATVTCSSCGASRAVARAGDPGLCPSCFPQIDLSGG